MNRTDTTCNRYNRHNVHHKRGSWLSRLQSDDHSLVLCIVP